MNRLVEYSLEDGTTLAVEIDELRPAGEGGIEPVSLHGAAMERAEETLEQVVGRIKPIGAAVIGAVKGWTEAPDELSVEFGLKLGMTSGVVVACGSAEANLSVSLKWTKPEPASEEK